MNNITIRKAVPEDASDLLKIYEPYVTDTAITFEYDVPSVEEFRSRIETITKRYPYLVMLKDHEIIGYAYAGVFKGRSAYDWSVETTIYLDSTVKGCGFGRMLYQELEEELKEQGIKNLYACIAVPHEKEDPYCDRNSMDFHEHLGYELIGTFHLCGYKFNRWYDMVWMEKMIGEHTTPVEPVHFPQM